MTIHGRGAANTGFAYDNRKTPGPAGYDAVDPSYTTRRAPIVTLKSRSKLPPVDNRYTRTFLTTYVARHIYWYLSVKTLATDVSSSSMSSSSSSSTVVVVVVVVVTVVVVVVVESPQAPEDDSQQS